MATLELIILLLVAVLISAVLERVIPRFSLPLIQIALGFFIAVTHLNPANVSLDPKFFLILFVAPLLFHDSKESDKLALWEHRKGIFSLVVGLVVAIMICVGFVTHLMEPSIPLAAAFALGAALGPTDAVAVAALSSVAKLSRKENAFLQGESLLNDATGVVAFQFAVAAALTGAFSPIESAQSFLWLFIGGVAYGLVFGWIAGTAQNTARNRGLDSTTFHVLFDISLPFVIYVTAEALTVSGIISVVAAGLLMSSVEERKISPSASRMSIVNSSVWGVAAFTLNGIVFTMLGMELPNALKSTWDDVSIGNGTVLFYVAVLTLLLVVVRFIWVVLMNHISYREHKEMAETPLSERIRSALVTTIGGAKGAVTLSIIFSIPYITATGEAFPQRHLIIFLASGVILCTLILANFLLPLLAPKDIENEQENHKHELQEKVTILRQVIERLAVEGKHINKSSTAAVISSYNRRIEHLQQEADIETKTSTELRIQVIQHEQDYIFEQMAAGTFDEFESYQVLRRLSRYRTHLKRHVGQRFDLNRFHHVELIAVGYIRTWVRKFFGKTVTKSDIEVTSAAQAEAIRYLHSMLIDPNSPYPTEMVAEVLLAYQNSHRAMHQNRPSITHYTSIADHLESAERLAYHLELEEIQNALAEERISRKCAKQMSDNVYLMMVDLEISL